MERDRAMAIGRHRQQHQRPGIDPGGDMQLHAVLRQHGVQSGHRLRNVGQPAEIGVFRKQRDGDARGGRRQAGLIAAVDQHQAGRIDDFTQDRRLGHGAEGLLEVALGQGTQAGIAPILVAHAGQAALGEGGGGGGADGRVAGQAVMQALVAREERVGAVAQRLVHAASATTAV